ncbi:MaoC family dehydratase [Streptomyces lavendofoliae]|uniref:MaoC family dehydratase n=1 Tax=Streptomyces lavendofoliae TaxID=67314 RepID=UPI001E4CE038|nr:MaoC/PaaZ C-terminal domain-containing protein [Streptomyces lavendofoliae]
MTSLPLTLAAGALRSPFKRPGRGGPRPGGPDAGVPGRRYVATDVRIDPARLGAYARVCGFPDRGPAPGPVPLPYPHVLAFPLAMRLMAARDFPLPLLGLVHTWIEVVQHRPPRPYERLELTVAVTGTAPHRRGTEATVTTEARVAGEPVWESRSGYLARHRPPAPAVRPPAPDHPAQKTPAPDHPTGPRARAEWHLDAGLGRRYGGVSGDRNPIHLYPLTARLFGYPRPVAHGMWTFARCLAEQDPAPRHVRVRADFKAPVLLPARLTYAAGGDVFQLRDGDRVHLTGTVTSAARP